jgi:hypothetical protein
MDIGSLFGWFNSGNISNVIALVIGLIFVGGLLGFLLIVLRNKKIYRYKARIYRIREGGTHKEANFKAGYIMRKNSAPYFRIKTSWFKGIDLITTPNPKYIDEEDRVYYKQIDVDTYVQMKREMRQGKLIMTPVETDVKYGAILSIQRIKEVLRLEPAWKKILPYFGLSLMAVVFIIAYAILINKCSG